MGQPVGTRHSVTQVVLKLTWAEREAIARAIDDGKLDSIDSSTRWALYDALIGRR